MLKFAGRKIALSLGLAASLAFSSIGFAWGTGNCVMLVAPLNVWAGQTIHGYVAGGHTPMTVYSTGKYGPLPVMPSPGGTPVDDPLHFAIPTFEPMRGSIVTITGGDPTGQSDTATVLVI